MQARRAIWAGLVAGALVGAPAALADAPEDRSDTDSDAEDGSAPDAGDGPVTVGEEMVVYSELEVVRRRRVLEQRLRGSGYRPGKKKDDRTIYRPEVAWKPTVVVYEDGFVIMRRSRVRFEPWVKGKTKAVWLSCIPPLGLMCIKLGGRLVSPARLSAQKEKTLAVMDAPLDDWQEAIASRATQDRLSRQIPDELEALWELGVPMGGVGGEPISEPADRRAAILAFWAGRSCTPEGAAAREVAALFLEYEVQASPFPLTLEEVAAAQAAQRCSDILQISVPSDSPALPSAPMPPTP